MVYVPLGDRPIGRNKDPEYVHPTDLLESEDFETCDSCEGSGCEECDGEIFRFLRARLNKLTRDVFHVEHLISQTTAIASPQTRNTIACIAQQRRDN